MTFKWIPGTKELTQFWSLFHFIHPENTRKPNGNNDEKWVNPLSASPTKCSNTPKQFIGNLPTNCLSVSDHFVGLVLKGLRFSKVLSFIIAQLLS